MKCKFCSAEMGDDAVFCPACGMDNSEQTAEESSSEVEILEETSPEAPDEAPSGTEIVEGKPISSGRIALLAVLAIAAVALVAALIFSSVKNRNNDAEPDTSIQDSMPTDDTQDTTPLVTDGTDPSDASFKSSYTVSDEEVLAAGDQVVATLGDATLTNRQLQVYYWMSYSDFMNTYGSYAAYFGLDASTPLDQQTTPDGNTWQQYFLETAIATWQQFQSLVLCAEEEGFTLSDSDQALINQIPEDLAQTAIDAGYDTVEELLLYSMGPGATVEDYQQYVYNYQLGSLYFESKYNALQFTEQEISDYFDANADTFAEQGITKDDGFASVDVRHILVMPEGGTTDDSGVTTYSDEEWEACRAKAETLLEQWLSSDATEDSFAELAISESEDPGSASNGGLYTGVMVGQMLEPFENWCFDESRQPGDYGLVQTDYGYHIMYFVSSIPIWYAQAEAALVTDASNSIIDDSLAKYPMTVDYSAVVIGQIPEDPAQ